MTTLTPSEQATLAKLRAGTHVVVPVELTGEMIDAGKSWCGKVNYTEFGPAWVPSPKAAYRAMITASQEGK